MQPVFGGTWFDVAECICELVCPSFYLSKDTFDAVPIPVRFMLESEAMTVAGCLQPRRSIAEKDRVVDDMFFAESREEHLDQR